MAEYVVWFKDVNKNSINTAGGKGANLGEMYNSKFPVPIGFIVTADAYRYFISSLALDTKIQGVLDGLDIQDTAKLQESAKKIQDLILSEQMPTEVQTAVLQAYEDMTVNPIALKHTNKEALSFIKEGRDPPFVAARSSATAEDLPSASFAGQQSSFMNVRGKEGVIEAVRKCWASLFTARAIYYREKNNFDHLKVAIAVVIQRMINSEQAGVMFSVNPATNNQDEIVINAAYGLGDAVVGGQVEPDMYTIDKNTDKVKDIQVKPQEWGYFRDPNTGQTIKKSISPELQKKQVLSDAQISVLTKLAKMVEKHYNAPQDMEWAIENHKVYLLQTRAVTTFKKEEKYMEQAQIKTQAEPLLEGITASQGIAVGPVRLINNMDELNKVQKGEVMVTKMTTPDMVPAMEKAVAIVTDEGGVTSHAAIVSREMGTPCIVGTEHATLLLKEGMIVTVDATHAKVYEGEITTPTKEEAPVQPKEPVEIRAEEPKPIVPVDAPVPYIVEAAVTQQVQEQPKPVEESKPVETPSPEPQPMAPAPTQPAQTPIAAPTEPTQTKTKVKVIMDLPHFVDRAAKTGADGVGLLRIETMIAGNRIHPAEYIRQGRNEDYIKLLMDGIGTVARAFEGKPVWVRTSDMRTDEYKNLEGGGKEPHEMNPMLGWHGIRRGLDDIDILKSEFIAIKRLQDTGLTNLGVMIPFVINKEEVEKAKQAMQEVGLQCKFGVMIETPASVWIIQEICDVGIDFVSFGTNDLTQTTLGVDRNNEHLAKLYNWNHPAVKKSVELVIGICKENNVQTSICGQAGSEPDFAEFLIKNGIDSISANVDAVDKIRELVKRLESNLQ